MKRASLACLLLALVAACQPAKTSTSHYPNGELWTIRRQFEERPVDAWIVLWPGDSTRHEEFYEDGRRVGRWRTASPRGELLLERHYVDDELNGEWKRYLPGGQIVESGTFTNGVPTGLWQWWAPDGTLLRSAEADGFPR